MNEKREVCRYVFELLTLKLTKRSGWWAAGVKDPETVAEHLFLASVIAYVLSKMEGLSEERSRKLAVSTLFHDDHEARTTDLHKIAQRYFVVDSVLAKNIRDEQTSNLPENIRNGIRAFVELEEDEKKILKDADLLECAFQAKFYTDIGYPGCKDWLSNIEKKLSTDSAKSLFNEIVSFRFEDWWKGLKNV